MLFWGAVCSFLGTGFLITFYSNHLSEHRHSIRTFRQILYNLREREGEIDWVWFHKITCIIFFIFVGTYFYNFAHNGLIPMFSDNPNEDRFLFLSGNLFIAMAGASGTLVMMLCTELVLIRKVSRSLRISAAIMLLISFILYFSLVTRMPLVRTFIYMVVIIHYMHKQISLKTVLIFSAFIIVFFLIGTVIRVDVVEFSELASRLKINVPAKYIPFTNPYAYAINNIWNMDFGFRKFIDGIHQYNISYGFELFRGFFFFTRLETVMQNAYGFDSLFNDSVVKINGLNTVLYIWHFYKDFGIFGLFAISTLLSVMIHIFYYNTILSPTHFRVAFMGLIISMIVFSFMIPLWSFWNLYYETAVLLLAHKSIRLI